jgi:rod shape-determining protein MreC
VRNIFLFIRRYFNFIFFLLLQALALSMLFRYNSYHEAAFDAVASEMSGKVNLRYNSVEYYFQLKRTNEELVKENERLRNLLKADFQIPDSSQVFRVDTILVDSLEQYRKYQYLPAKVISNSVQSQNNYLTLHRGYNQGIRKDMAVVSPNGVVGSVVNVSKNMSTVMSLLHRQSRISSSLKRTGETGTVEWDGRDPLTVTLKNIPRTASLKKGDTILTSRYSDKFPPGEIIGRVDTFFVEKASNFYTVKLRPATNFFNVQYVYVVNNLMKEEQQQLEKATKGNQ